MSAQPPQQRNTRGLQILVQLLRVLIFSTVLFLIHWQHQRRAANELTRESTLDLKTAQLLFPEAKQVVPENDNVYVRDANEQLLGTLRQTSPECDNIIGFSGPTNVLIGIDADQIIAGIAILSSKDTRDHLQHVKRDPRFLESFSGISADDIASIRADAVSGATLTSLAIRDSVIQSVSGVQPVSRFNSDTTTVTLAEIQTLFPSATACAAREDVPHVWDVLQETKPIGQILRTSPAADNIVGFQGPTDSLLAIDNNQHVCGLLVRGSFDNEPYTDYVREDGYFLSLFNDMSLSDLANSTLESLQVEGVSGATMTSVAVAEGVFKTAKEYLQQQTIAAQQALIARQKWWHSLSVRDWGTCCMVACGLLLGFTSLRGYRKFRIVFQICLIAYLGLMNGDMVSQAMLVGWTQNGIPLKSAFGLVLLTVVAFLVPLTTRTNAYCSHLCPHGAIQQLVKNKLPWRVRLNRRARRALSLLPWLLLLWVIVVAMSGLAFSLVDIEPFDAWLFRIAGWATITVAVVGLVSSLFVPMAYCRFGCPTGALLDYFRFNRQSHRIGRADVAALICLGVAIALIGI